MGALVALALDLIGLSTARDSVPGLGYLFCQLGICGEPGQALLEAQMAAEPELAYRIRTE